MKQQMKKYMWIVYVIGASTCIAVLSHLFIFNEWLGESYFIGIRDGMSQMLPFKHLLYDNYTSGNFFYADHFGMGGGTYGQLGYYYSTSIVFIITVIITYLLEIIGIIQHPTLEYWADATLIVSMIRMGVILVVSTIFIRYIGFKTRFAFIGAIIYATSTIYFRHVVYWELFADAMIWLPLVFLGIERIIRGKSSVLFMIAVAVSMIDNFYFASIHFIIAMIYMLGRNIFRFDTDIRTTGAQVLRYFLGGLAGLGLSAFAFVPSVIGYVQNDRPLFSEEFAKMDMVDTPLLDGKMIVIPSIIIASLWLFRLYSSRLFRLFAILTGIMIMMHVSPYVASIFNGFSAPQYHWEYVFMLVGGVVVTYVLTHAQRLSRKSVFIAFIGTLITYSIFYVMGEGVTWSTDSIYSLVIAIIAIGLVWLLFIWKRSNMTQYILIGTIIGTSIWIANGFQAEKVTFAGTDEEVTKKWVQSDENNGRYQNELIDLLHVREKDPLMRIDWMIPEQNNTPLVRQFRGFSANSSVLNKHILHFYGHDLMIDMGQESVSRYGSLGDRTNLFSLLYGKYKIDKIDEGEVPFGFEEVTKVGPYVAYENTHALPFARTTSTVYTEESLERAHPIEKERAMIDGVILDESTESEPIESIEAEEIMNVSVETNGSTYEDELLHVTEETGGLDLVIKDATEQTGDYYVSFYIKRQDQDQIYDLTVNDYETSRQKNTSIDRTGIDDVLIRVPAEEVLSIRVPEGEYVVKDIQIFHESYETLVEETKRQEKEKEIFVSMDKNKIYMNVDNQANDSFVTIPVPYEKGWSAQINGKRADVLRANYSFISIPIEAGDNEITLTYMPPYFIEMIVLSILTCCGLMIFRKKT